jgi:hypothetical protein
MDSTKLQSVVVGAPIGCDWRLATPPETGGLQFGFGLYAVGLLDDGPETTSSNHSQG